MAFKDILLQLRSYPDPTSPAAIEQAVGFAAMVGATLSALTFRIEIPNAGSTLVNLMLDIPEIVASERQKSETNVRTLVDLFESAARRQNVTHRQSVEVVHNFRAGRNRGRACKVARCHNDPGEQGSWTAAVHCRVRNLRLRPADDHLPRDTQARRSTLCRRRGHRVGLQPACGAGSGRRAADFAARPHSACGHNCSGEDYRHRTLRRRTGATSRVPRYRYAFRGGGGGWSFHRAGN